LGVFSGFSKICSLEEQENFAIPALFFVIWAFSCHFLIFVPFLPPNQEAKQKKKGTKFQNFLQNAQCQAKHESIRLILPGTGVQKQEKPFKTPNCQKQWVF